MQGLSIGLATVMITGQFTAFAGLFEKTGKCVRGDDGGSTKVLSFVSDASTLEGRLRIYFDKACKSLYMDETLKVRVVSDSPVKLAVGGKLDVYSRAGNKVAVLSVPNNKLTIVNNRLKLHGPATLKPVGKGLPVVRLATSCEIPSPVSAIGGASAPTVSDAVFPLAKATVFNCVGATAQSFPAVGKSIAVLGQIKFRIAGTGRTTIGQSSASTLYVGAVGALGVKVTAQGQVQITGKKQRWSSTTLSGQVGNFVLFAPKPTDWRILDRQKDAKFSIRLTSNVTRIFAGSVAKLSNGRVLAPIRLDASGSGSIEYSNGLKAKIASWALTR